MAKMKSPFRCAVRCTGGYPYYNSPPGPSTASHNAHGGEDYVPKVKSVESNWDLYATCAGTVYKSKKSGDYGNYIVIISDDGYFVLYAHLDSRAVSAGDRVAVGTKIGVAGNTGNSTGRHLHIEVSDMRGVSYNAVTWYSKLKEHRVRPSDYIDFSDYTPGGDWWMKIWKNGSTKELVFQTTTDCKEQKNPIGSLAPREQCECYGIIDGCYLVVYKVDGTAAKKKTGFVKYSGGVTP